MPIVFYPPILYMYPLYATNTVKHVEYKLRCKNAFDFDNSERNERNDIVKQWNILNQVCCQYVFKTGKVCNKIYLLFVTEIYSVGQHTVLCSNVREYNQIHSTENKNYFTAAMRKM